MDDISKPSGTLKRSSDLFHSANPQITAKIGIVKSNVDAMRSNSLQVYIVGSTGLNPNDRRNWITVFFLSPFYGATQGTAPNNTPGSFVGNPTSYGMWMSPPDIGSQVLCLFAQGDMNYGFYIGCIPDPAKLTMIPAVAGVSKIISNEKEAASYGNSKKLPATNINTNNQAIAGNEGFIDAAKPVNSYAAHVYFQQGTLRDPIRGPISSSAQRESPSRVGWGVSTPGRPIYSGGITDDKLQENLTPDKAKDLRVISRRPGHSIVMDDGDAQGNDRLIRIRTTLGHQILMSDDGQTLMILHSNGQSYVELGKEGTVDVYSTNSINLRTQGDLNLHADRNINIHAKNNLNLHAKNVQLDSEENLQQRVGGDYKILTTNNASHKVGGTYAVSSGDEASLVSGAGTFINGAKVNLNSGKPSTKPSDVSPIPIITQNDTLFDAEKGFLVAVSKLQTICSRAPAHAPWSDAGLGVDVTVKLTGDDNLPAPPSDAAASLNEAADAVASGGVTSAAVASAPQGLGGVSDSINEQTTRGLLATAATDAKTSPGSAALTTGGAIVPQNNTVVAYAGASIPQTAQQLDSAGILKPGASVRVNAVAAATGNITQAFSPVLFTTGNFGSFSANATNQASAFIKNLQKSTGALQSLGAITGSETPTQVSGLVYAATNQGTAAVVDALNASNPATAATAAASNAVGQASDVLKNIKSGNFAASISTGLTKALSGPQLALQALNDKFANAQLRARGLAAAMFAAVKKAIKPLKPNVPQDLEEIAKENQAATALKGLATAAVSAGVNAAIQSSGAGAYLAAANTALSVAKGLSQNTSTESSSLNLLPGGAGSAAALSNGSTPLLPGAGDPAGPMDQAKNLMADAATNAMNNLSGADAAKTGIAAANAVAGQLGKSPLKDVLSSILPVGLATQLQAMISSVATPDSGLQAPVISTDTIDRKDVDAAAKGQLKDTRVQPPSYTSPKNVTPDNILAARTEYLRLQKEVTAVDNERMGITEKANDVATKINELGPEARNPSDSNYSTYQELVVKYKDYKDQIKVLNDKYLDASKAANNYFAKTYVLQNSFKV